MGHSSKHSLEKVQILGGLSNHARSSLEKRCHWRTFQRGEQIVEYMDTSDNVFFVAVGKARVAIYSEAGKIVAFRDIGPGDMFGEFSALDREPRSATVEALGPCHVGVLSSDGFRELLKSENSVALALLLHLVSQVRALTSRVYEFSTLAVQNRIHAELLRLARQNQYGGAKARIMPTPTHAEIASHISTHREAVTRELNRLADIGLVKREGTTLYIEDIERLALMVQEATGE